MKTKYKSRITFLITIILFYGNTTFIGAQSIKKAYKSLEKLEYAKAYDEFNDVLSKDRTNASALFGLTLLYTNEGTGYTDVFKAWKQAKTTKENINKLTQEDSEVMNEYFLNTDKLRRPVRYKMEKHLDEVEQKLIRFMREENDLEVVNQFLMEFKDFEHYENIVHIRNYIEFRKAESEHNLEAIQGFIKNRPEAAQIEIAKEKRNELAFKAAKAKNTAEALNQFISSYPGAIHIPEAETMRNQLEFNKIQQVNTFEAYQQYIEKFPNSTYIPRAREVQKKLVYEQAKKINTIEAYNKFISMYPDGAQYIDIFNLKTAELGKKFNTLNSDFKAPVTWTRGYDNEADHNFAKDMCVDGNGNIILAGATMQDDTSQYTDAWIIKLDAQQKMLWNKVMGERFNDFPAKIITDNDNNIIVAGVINRVNDTIPGQAWIFKMNEKGEKIWNRKLEIPEVLCMDINSKNEIILGGYQPNDTLPDNYVLLKLTPQGRKFWKRSYESFGRVNDVKVTAEDDILIAGDKWIWKINTYGYIKWEKSVAETDSIVAIYELSEGNIAFLGNRGANQCLIMMLNSKGKPVMENSFGGGDLVCRPIDLISKDGKLCFVVKLNSFYKLIYSDMKGNLLEEYDFSPGVVTEISSLHASGDGQAYIMVTADNIGQKKDIIISKIK